MFQTILANAFHAAFPPPHILKPPKPRPAPAPPKAAPRVSAIRFSDDGTPIFAEWYVLQDRRNRDAARIDARTGKVMLIDRRKPWQKSAKAFSFDRTGCHATPRQGPRN